MSEPALPARNLLKLVKKGELEYFTDLDLFKKAGILVAFTTRLGGVSSAPYNLLNLAQHVGDSRDDVASNRELVAAALEFDIKRLTTAEQVHGSNIRVVADSDIGAGGPSGMRPLAATDAIITIEEQLPLMIFTADCVPIIIVEPEEPLVAIVHAGWRGTLAQIASLTVRKIVEKFHLPAAGMSAYIGPAIRACSYEVDSRLHQRFRASFPRVVGEETILDLPTVNIDQLMVAGLKPANIHDLGLCTACQAELFYSYRRNKTTGRQGTIAMISR